MAEFPTLPTGPLPHVAMDYAQLRAEGLRLLGELAGDQWTDYNAHDPGITILEQVCYAITDLAYRVDFSLPDLLACDDYEAHASLPSAATILTSDPVTVGDLRKLALDAGVRSGAGSNAWVEDVLEPECAFYHHAPASELHLSPDPGAVEGRPIELRGLHRVWLPSGEADGDGARADAISRLHGCRPLCEDLDVELLRREQVWVAATIEISGDESALAILETIVDNIETYFAAAVEFETIDQARARASERPEGCDEIFCGPSLEHGFIPDAKIVASERRRVVYASDLIHTINDVDGVRAIRQLAISTSASGTMQTWAFSVSANGVSTLSPDSPLVLMRDGRPLPLGANAVREALDRRTPTASPEVLPLALRDIEVVAGRDRDLARYHSILNQFPEAYGVGRFGLPSSASPQRKAQAKQLQAYLLLFDQLLANEFSQLAHARELFSHFDEAQNTYFSQRVDDPNIALDLLRRGEPDEHAQWLADHVVATTTDDLGSLDRRNRFLSHLLARYAEQLDEHALADAEDDPKAQVLMSIRRKLAFLQAYPRLGSRRGTGCDVFDAGSSATLSERFKLELGLTSDDLRIIVVEHVLLRPIAEDKNQIGDEGEPSVPLLADAQRPDPYSQQLTIVVQDPRSFLDDARATDIEQLGVQLVAEHTPAHISASVLWLGDDDDSDDWTRFRDAHAAFRELLADYRDAKLFGGDVDTILQLRSRDARDRLVEELGLGLTYPLRDVPLPDLLVINADTSANIEFEFSQLGVTYRLCDDRTGDPIVDDQDQPHEIVGTGGAATLVTPVVFEDVNYKILAVKTESESDADSDDDRRAAWLHTRITVKEGIDVRLDAAIHLDLLDANNDVPTSTDARLTDFGDGTVELEVYASQEGVRYRVVDHARSVDDEGWVLSDEVVGTGGTIKLSLTTVEEDVDLRIHGSKTIHLEDETTIERANLLDIILPLRVRANPDLEVALKESPALPIDFGAEARVYVRQSQESTHYRVFYKTISDDEFNYDEPPADGTYAAKAGGGRDVYVTRSLHQNTWQIPEFTDLDLTVKGTGATIAFTRTLADDTAWLVRAHKWHTKKPMDDPDQTSLGSVVQLVQPQASLVHPDPTPGLRARAHVDGATVTAFTLYDGQPGVYYTLNANDGQTSPPLPGYFHKLDENDQQINKGIDQIQIGIDNVVADDPQQIPATVPYLLLDPAPVDTSWSVIARKATTDIEEDVTGEILVAAAPTIYASDPVVAVDGSTTIVIEASVTGERYQLLLDDQDVGEAIDGDGDDAMLFTDELDETTTYTVLITTLSDPEDPISVERAISVTVTVAQP